LNDLETVSNVEDWQPSLWPLDKWVLSTECKEMGLAISGGINGVDQFRMDVASKLLVKVDWSSAFCHLVLDSPFFCALAL
jgi:hypothetical protein